MTPPDSTAATLSTIERALSLEAHVLADHPDLTWQQLHNRLQFAIPPLEAKLAAEQEKRSRSGAPLWLHRYTPLRESQVLRTILEIDRTDGFALSPDGTWLASAGPDVTVSIWDAATGQRRATWGGESRGTWEGHEQAIPQVSISPDGTWLATASCDATVKIWDAATGEERATLHNHKGDPTGDPNLLEVAIAISPSGTQIASCASSSGQDDDSVEDIWFVDNTVKIWDVAGGRLIATLGPLSLQVRALAFSPDGIHLAATGKDDTVNIWNVITGEEVASRRTNTPAWEAQFSADGARLATAGWGAPVQIWDTTTWRECASLASDGAGVDSLCFSPDGSWLAAATREGPVEIWDVDAGTKLTTLCGRTGARFVVFAPDGSWLLTSHGTGIIETWDTALMEEESVRLAPDVLGGHRKKLTDLVFSPDGTWLASSSSDGTMQVWDAADGTCLATHDGLGKAIGRLAISPDGTWLASSGGGEVTLWDVSDPAELRERRRLDGHAVAISPDGMWLALTSGHREVRIWDVAAGSERATLEGRPPGMTWDAWFEGAADVYELVAIGNMRSEWARRATKDLAISPDATWLAAAIPDESDVGIWDTVTGLQHTSFRTGRVDKVVISPDGTWLATASQDATMIWDVRTMKKRATLERASDLAVSPDGTWLATASHDRMVKIWNTTTGSEEATLALPGSLSAVAIHPSAPAVACGDLGGSVHLACVVGIDYGPLIVTAVDLGNGLEIRCPHCNRMIPWQEDYRDQEMTCPLTVPGCGGPLKVNPFVVGERV